jgi:acyl transferase domain-containing protein/NADPH:quinone reductase-like Zn-dependent oxidoreductase/NADP-dependent 3-hydroxy acid dehydrogenase YdfG/acyl carrier protein
MNKKRVAIIGFSFRLPGTTRDQFWPDLLSGRNFVTQVDSERWSQEGYWHPKKSHAGTSYTFAAGSLGDVSGFDADFFAISPREAAQIDPQQRLLLELSWEALENAGIRPADIRGTRCGVYVGISTNDYSLRFADDLSVIDSSTATGTSTSITANRISYALDLRGPSMAVDTACSSSLVALHLACRSILSGESTQALAGGISLHLHPFGFVAFSKASMLSRRGACSVFDACGDGYVRSEGAGVFVLKDYDQALADGDSILAVVPVSLVNSDGKSSGLTVPSLQSQIELLKQAYSDSGIAPAEIDYIEAHGTGTAVGDPVETRALGEALGRFRAPDDPLLIGSIKSNLGHLEAAAAVAGLVKALHCIRHRTVPGNIHFETPNQNIHFDEWNLRVAARATPLKPAGKLVIGINSFGFGGTNAHVVLESPPAGLTGERPYRLEHTALPVLLSGRSPMALKAAARDLGAFLGSHADVDLYDVAYTAAFHREWHEHRAIVRADGTQSLVAMLANFAQDSGGPSAVETGTAVASGAGLAFVYSGNGSTWEGMGRRLMAEEPVFREAVIGVDEIFRHWAGYSLLDELAGENGPGRYRHTEIAQPALFAVQVGLTRVLRSRGVMPVAVAGHSVGEIAAAWACGALSLEQALQVIYHRSRLQGSTKGLGGMTAVALGEAAVRELLEKSGLSASLAIAGVNSSGSVTLAGEVAALEVVEAAIAQRKATFKRLDLDYAFHSPAMDAIRTETLEVLADMWPGPARIPFYSTVTGATLDGTQLGAEYWWRNIREPVQFDKAVRNMLAQGVRVFSEVGPHPVLRGYLAACLRDADIQGRVVPTIQRDDDSPDRIWSAICQVAIAGAPFDWRTFLPHRGRFVQLPNYPWQRERHWHGVSAESHRQLYRRRGHPLLGYRLQEADWLWESEVDTQVFPALADHVIGDAVVLPGSAYAEIALAAAQYWHGGDILEVEELEIRSPLILSDSRSKIVRFGIDSPDGGFTVRSRDRLAEGSWTVNAVGKISRDPRASALPKAPIVLPRRAPDFTGADHDGLTRAVGLDYGPAFRAIEAVWVEGGSACAKLRVPADIESGIERFHLHPALVDCTFQLIIQLLKDDYIAQAGTVYVPANIDGLLYRCGAAVPRMARATLHRCGPHSLTASFALFDADGKAVAWIREARFSSVRLRKSAAERLRYLDYHAIPKPHPLSASAPHQHFEQLHKKLAAVAHSAPRQGALKRYTEEIEPLLDALCSRFAARALKTLAGDGRILTASDMQACVAANPGAAPLIARLIGMLEEDRAIAAVRDGHDWQFLPETDPAAPEDIWNSLIADYPDYLPVFHAIGRVGMHLADLLSGRATPEQVLPRDCTPSRLIRPMLADAGLHAIEQAMEELLAQVLCKLPGGERLRIVEIGAGQPSLAAAVCKALDFNRCDYTYATTASLAPEEWYSLQDRFPAAQLRLIAPEEDHEASLPPASERYQLALLTSDFESEHDALRALAYARRQLSAGGSLVVLEHHQSRWMDFVFGVRLTWWSEDADGSWLPRHRPPQFWRHQMQRTGMQGTACLELSADGTSGPYLLLSQQAEQPGAIAQPLAPVARNWLLVADKEGVSARLAAQLGRMLEARGDRAIHVTPGTHFAALDGHRYQLSPQDAAQYGDLLQRLESSIGRLDAIVHLHGLGASAEHGNPLLLLEQQVDRCAAAAALLRACETTATQTACWLVTACGRSGFPRERGPQRAGASLAASMDAALWGFARTMMNEASGVTVRLVDIDDQASLDTLAYALMREISHTDAEQEVVLTASGDRYVPRLRVEAPATGHGQGSDSEQAVLRLGFEFPGQLRSLRWESHPSVSPAPDELEVEVRATGLNFRDVMYALGLLSEGAVENGFAGASLGLEFAGIVTSVGERIRGFAPGDRVLGFGPGSFSNRVLTKAACVSPIPAGMTFESAATIPSAFFTAYYALDYLARLQEGEKVLIHGAAGGVGIAAIQIAKWKGAEIFATAGSPEKRDFLRLLGVDHVFDSRSLAFADEIMAVTEGRGIDIVLNSLAGEAIDRNLRILKPFGRFLELGKRDFQENTRIGLRPFRNNISYFGIDADMLMKERPEFTAQLYREMMALFAEGILHPLPHRCFDAHEIVDAFRCMQQSRHIGKIVVTCRSGIEPMPARRSERPRLELSADASYLVTGGMSGFGRKTAEWLAARGARNLVLVGRRGPAAPEAHDAIAALEKAGVKVHAAACDVSDFKALSSLLSEIAVIFPPLRGIVHAATVIDDGLIRNLSRDQIRAVFAPKILGAQYLHQLTLDKQLDFFILFSSATTLFGNPGQGNYVAANTCVEAIAAARRSMGLPALCVRWGAIDDAGYLARNAEIKDALQSRMGGSPIQSAVALDALEELLLADRSGLGVLELDWGALKRFLPTSGSPKFSELASSADDAQSDGDAMEDVRHLLATLSAEELSATLVEMLKKTVAEILRMPADKIDEHRPLQDMGLDSLMGVELSTAVETRFAVRLPVIALSENPTISRLGAQIIAQLGGKNGATEPAAHAEVADQARQLAAQHAEEVQPDLAALAAKVTQAGRQAATGRMIQ